MDDANEVMTSIYDTLLQLRYPHITKAESKDVEATILSGENRICLLSWLLTEKSPSATVQLGKLRDVALEDRLFECYSQIGICYKKDLLLGKCSLKEQLPFLRLLLDFMRNVHVESFVSANKTEEIFTDLVKIYIDDVDQVFPLSNIKPKINYAEAVKYFEKTKREAPDNDCADVETNLSENSHMKVNDSPVEEERDVLFSKEQEKFIEAFQTISSWPAQPGNIDKAVRDSFRSDIKSTCFDFFTLKKILRAKDEISHIDIAKELPKTTTPLNAIIEDIVICSEGLESLNIMNDSLD